MEVMGVIQIRESIKQTIWDINFPLLCKTPRDKLSRIKFGIAKSQNKHMSSWERWLILGEMTRISHPKEECTKGDNLFLDSVT